MTSLRLLAVLNVLSSTPARAKRLAPRPDGPPTHFVSPRGEISRLAHESEIVRAGREVVEVWKNGQETLPVESEPLGESRSVLV